MRSASRGSLAAAIGSILWAAAPCPAELGEIRIGPPIPAPGDRIIVSIEGHLPDTCWTFLGFEVEGSGPEIAIEIRAEFRPGPCMDVLVPYAFEAEIGPLSSGAYSLIVADPQEKRALEFEVRPLTRFVPGEVNGDGRIDIADAVFVLSYLFSGGPAPACESAANVNGDSRVDLGDPVHLLNYLFAGGRPPQMLGSCSRDIACAKNDWIVFCRGHWACDCGECRAVCEMDSCGDGICDERRGETPASCPGDCPPGSCRPRCLHIGTRSEGWYDGCTGELIRYDFCAECEPICRRCGSKSEGWYESCDGELIRWDSCCKGR